MDMQKEIVDLLEEHNQMGYRPAKSDQSIESWKFTDKILRILFELNNRNNCQQLEINTLTKKLNHYLKIKPSPPIISRPKEIICPYWNFKHGKDKCPLIK